MPQTVGKGEISVDFVHPSVHLSVCPSVTYMANNSWRQRPNVPKFGRKVPHLRCDSHTSFKVKRSKVRVTGGRGHTVSAEPGSHTVISPRRQSVRCFSVVFVVTLWLHDAICYFLLLTFKMETVHSVSPSSRLEQFVVIDTECTFVACF